ncbi:hypothetical protein CLOM_g12411, partial [Closterium sp. NIES-68]
LCSDSIPKATTKDYHRHMHDLGNAAKCILSHRSNPMTFTRLVEKLSGGIPPCNIGMEGNESHIFSHNPPRTVHVCSITHRM